MEEPLQEAFFSVRCEAYHRCELGKFKRIVSLKMEAFSFFETSVLTRATPCNISEGIHYGKKIPDR
jgi:hypothetical protein